MNPKLQFLMQQFERAISKLDEVLRAEYSEITRDSAIQRFEFTFELCWKALKAYAEDMGSAEIYYPKEALKSAFQLKLLDDEQGFLRMLKNRNLTSHTYNESVANGIHQSLPQDLVLMRETLSRLKAKLGLQP